MIAIHCSLGENGEERSKKESDENRERATIRLIKRDKTA